jgi:mono/diheme cytochrome c family protein
MRAVVNTTVELGVSLACVLLLVATAATAEPRAIHGPAEASPSHLDYVGEPTAADDYTQTIVPLFNKYCISCHGGKKPKGDLDLTQYASTEQLTKKMAVMEALLANVRNGDMPPDGKPKPTRVELDQLTNWLDGQIVKAHLNGKRDPGRVTMRRLNRAEYNNTVRDLLGVNFKPADDFPADDVGYGFDNIGDVLTIPPLLLEKYLNAAQRIADQAVLARNTGTGTTVRRFQGREMQPRNVGSNYGKNNQSRLLASNAELTVTFDFPVKGKYALRFRAFGQQAGNEPPKLDLKLDGKSLKVFSIIPVEADNDARKSFEYMAQVPPGQHRVSLAYINDFYDEASRKDRNVVIVGMSIEGPLDAPKVVEKHPVLEVVPEKNITPQQAARQNLTRLAERAYRRPVQSAEIDKLMKLFDNATKRGDNFSDAFKLPLQAILVSPHFLFRVETDSTTDSVRKLNNFELASRLSYFLWSTMPDEQLYAAARQGKLTDPETLAMHARRMLRDERAAALIENFAGQWLQLRNLKNSTPDPKRFPTFDEPLRQAMQRETELFFQDVMKNDLKLTQFLDADFTFVNERLARHYGMKDIKGAEFRKVSLKETPRRGILTQASILTLTSNPTRTSPVKRGKWVLETILGTPPPPPPPDAGELKEGDELRGTLRQRMEQHRANPNCATCHNRMDPIGFGFENFDAVGAFRTKDGPHPVEPGGVLPSGQSFQTPLELVAILKQRDEDFRRCLTEKMLTYALGRGIESSDRQYVVEIAKATLSRGDTITALVQSIVTSDPFCQRRTAK